jgi:ACS family allantoate permease-like MFS transporter
VAGAITMGWALFLIFVLPDTPSRASKWMFSENERRLLAERAAETTTGDATVEWAQVREAVMDPKVWLMTSMGAAIYVCNGGSYDRFLVYERC